MNTFIALLRGINVSGQKRILMAELREAMISHGFENVKTYIQSGNIILDSAEDHKKAELKIAKIILNHFGFEVPVLLKTGQELQSILDNCPFEQDIKEKSYFIMLYTKPSDELVTETSGYSHRNEEFIITDECVYFYSRIGFGKSKFNNIFFERKLKTTATARNYKTMLKLLSLSSETS